MNWAPRYHAKVFLHHDTFCSPNFNWYPFMLHRPTNGFAACFTWFLLNLIVSYLFHHRPSEWNFGHFPKWTASSPNITRYYCTNSLARSILVLEYSADPPLWNYKSLSEGEVRKTNQNFAHITCFTHPRISCPSCFILTHSAMTIMLHNVKYSMVAFYANLK